MGAGGGRTHNFGNLGRSIKMHKLRGRKIIRDRYTLHWRWCCHCEEYMDQADYKKHQCTWIGIKIPDPKGEFYVTNFKAVELPE